MRLGVLEQSSWLQLLTLAQSFGRPLCHVSGRKLPDGVECKATAAAATSSCSQLWTDCKGLEVAQQMGRETFLLSLFLSKMWLVEIQPVEPKPSGMPVGDVWLAWRVCLSRMACPVSSYQWPQKVRFVINMFDIWIDMRERVGTGIRLVCGMAQRTWLVAILGLAMGWCSKHGLGPGGAWAVSNRLSYLSCGESTTNVQWCSSRAWVLTKYIGQFIQWEIHRTRTYKDRFPCPWDAGYLEHELPGYNVPLDDTYTRYINTPDV